MTPTLLGRWQTRLLLIFTVGVLISLPFVIGLVGSGASVIYFWILAYVAVLGLGWDILYNHLQTYRWDRDWPAIYQVLAGIWEMFFVWCGIKIIGFLPLPMPKSELFFGIFFQHYTCVWLSMFIASQTIMRVFYPRWRFRGGQWL